MEGIRVALYMVDSKIHPVFRLISKAWNNLTGLKTALLIKGTLVVSVAILITGLMITSILTDGWFGILLSTFFAICWGAIGIFDWLIYTKAEQVLEDMARENVENAAVPFELHSLMSKRHMRVMFWNPWIVYCISTYILTMSFSFTSAGLILYWMSLHLADFWLSGKKSALSKAKDKIVTKAKELIPSPAPTPVPIPTS